MDGVDDTTLNTIATMLKGICGTAVTGQVSSCPHDHGPQAEAMVNLVLASSFKRASDALADDHPGAAADLLIWSNTAQKAITP